MFILTLDDETEAKTAKGQVGKHRLFLRLAYDVTSCVVTGELESQGKFSRLDILFNLKEADHHYYSIEPQPNCRKQGATYGNRDYRLSLG